MTWSTVAYNAGHAVTSASVDLTSAAVGDVAIFVSNNESSLPGLPAGWVTLVNQTSDPGGSEHSIFYRLIDGTEGTSASVTNLGNYPWAWMILRDTIGPATSVSLLTNDVTNGVSAAALSIPTGTVAAGDAVVAFASNDISVTGVSKATGASCSNATPTLVAYQQSNTAPGYGAYLWWGEATTTPIGTFDITWDETANVAGLTIRVQSTAPVSEPVLVGTAEKYNYGNGTSQTAIPGTYQAGDIAIIWISALANQIVPALTAGGGNQEPADWTLLTAGQSTNDSTDSQQTRTYAYWKELTSGAEPACLVNNCGPVIAYQILVFRNIDTPVSLGHLQDSAMGSFAISAPGGAVTSGSWILGLAAHGEDSTTNDWVTGDFAGSGFTFGSMLYEVGSNRNNGLGNCSFLGEATSTTLGTLTATRVNDDAGALGITIELPITGGGGPPLINYTMSSALGSLAQAGQSLSLLKNSLLGSANGSFTETGNDSSLLHNRKLPSLKGTLTETGQAAGTKYNRRVLAARGVNTLSGFPAALHRDSLVRSLTGSYTLTGQQAALGQDASLAADPASYTFTGQSAGMLLSHVLPGLTGSLALSGKTANLLYLTSRELLASPASFLLTGQSASLTYLSSKSLPAEPRAFAAGGQPARLKQGRLLRADTAPTSLAGPGAALVYGNVTKLLATTGSLVLLAPDASLERSRLLAADPEAFLLAGPNILLGKVLRLTAAPGAFENQFQNVELLLETVLIAGEGTFTFTGRNALLKTTAASVYTYRYKQPGALAQGIILITRTDGMVLRNRNHGTVSKHRNP